MKLNTYNSAKVALKSNFKLFAFLFRYLPPLTVLLFCPGCPRVPPPNVSTCTRIEIIYPRSALNYFVRDTTLQNSVLNTEEKNYIHSFDSFVINDQQRIKTFAHNLSQGSYYGQLRGTLAYSQPVHITCYRDNKCLISFTLYGESLVTKDKRMFKYSINLADLVEPLEIQPFKSRFRCAMNMRKIYTLGSLYDVYREKINTYPEPNQWCDNLVESWRNEHFIDKGGLEKRKYSEDRIYRIFMCPSADELVYVENLHGRPNGLNSSVQSVPQLECHYAMNPNCKPDSPPDMVLLFETKAGWNQHGGPELFTFDNHKPRGGCVLLNDGTVKFIRTKEVLQKLRWK